MSVYVLAASKCKGHILAVALNHKQGTLSRTPFWAGLWFFDLRHPETVLKHVLQHDGHAAKESISVSLSLSLTFYEAWVPKCYSYIHERLLRRYTTIVQEDLLILCNFIAFKH